jgi:phage tail-like protein
VADVYLVRAFNFLVTLHQSERAEEGAAKSVSNESTTGTALVDGGFQECSGLDIEMDVQDYPEGGRNDGIIRRIGRAKYQPLVLKRGMFLTPAGALENSLWRWFQEAVGGQVLPRRYDGIVNVLGVGGAMVATWTFTRGLPAKIVGPALNAKTGEIAIEELHIAHEGLRLRIPPPPPAAT